MKRVRQIVERCGQIWMLQAHRLREMGWQAPASPENLYQARAAACMVPCYVSWSAAGSPPQSSWSEHVNASDGVINWYFGVGLFEKISPAVDIYIYIYSRIQRVKCKSVASLHGSQPRKNTWKRKQRDEPAVFAC